MRLTIRILLLYNIILTIPVIIYLIFWSVITISLFSLVVFFFALLVLLLVLAIFKAVRLKVRILRDVRDHKLQPVKAIYKGASKVNFRGYLIFYPMMFVMAINSPIGGIFIIIADIIALPLLIKIIKLEKEYKDLKEHMCIGQCRCKRCKVALFYQPNRQQWVCYKCGDRY
ncbi:MAG: hypothetical protein KAS67_04995 [Thermoplasmata archaeon]|nr:hypothetical protein [Thermoplasmata archaeon]